MNFTQFIREHADDDCARLLLGRDKWPGIDMERAVCTIEGRRRMRDKVPSWSGCEALVYPNRLCTEQCSSEATARYKAALARDLGARRIADLSGGLGVDAWAFSCVAEAVLYNEMNPVLAHAVRDNFAALGAGNIQVRNVEITPATLPDVLGDFRPDLIYLDPARRAADGRKLFRIEDCSPPVLPLLPALLAAAPRVLLKLSPMADITLLAKSLGGVREVHAVGAEGECKELLFLLEAGWRGAYGITVSEGSAQLRFTPAEEAEAAARYPDAPEALGPLLFEPGKALAKAGAFQLLSARFGLRKAGRSTHLYFAEKMDASLSVLGKYHRIESVLPMGNAAFRRLRSEGLKAGVTARNLPLTSEALRRKIGCADGAEAHIFGLRIDFAGGASGNYLVKTLKSSGPGR